MINSQVLELLTDAQLSPEELAETIGISGMTVRRWLKKPNGVVPRVYVPAIREACYTLITQGRLSAESAAVGTLLALSPSREYSAALRNLGLQEDFDPHHKMSQDEILIGLSRIGIQNQKQDDVNHNRKKVFSFKKLGDEWSYRISTLWQLVDSKKLNHVEKSVAYGALFYLLTPIDFIPDHIPFFGMLDDFGVLGIALAYYKNHLHQIV
jgi:uncharacterized membrane protein YkvA (DUF1232 family)